MAGVVAQGEEEGGESGPAQGAAHGGGGEAALIGGQHPGQPTEDGDQVEVAQVDQQGMAEHEGHGPKERRRAGEGSRRLAARDIRAEAQGAQEDVDAQSGPIDVAHDQPLHPPIAEVGLEQKEQQVGQIEKPGLNIADKGRAAVEGGVPQGQGPLVQLGGGKAIGGVEKADQIPPIRGLEDLPAHHAPEEAQGEQTEHAPRGHIQTERTGGGPGAQQEQDQEPNGGENGQR